MGFLNDTGLEPGAESETAVEETPETTEETVETTVDESPEESQPQEDTAPKAESTEVPASFQKRINELTYRAKSEREARLKLEEELKAVRQNPARPTSEEEKKEQNAKQYLKDLYKEIINETAAQEQEEDRKLNDELDHVATLYTDFDRKKVLETMEKYGIDNVEKAYLAFKEMNRMVAETKEKTKREVLSKPKSPSSVKTQDGSATKFSEEDIKGKSIFELAELAKKEAGIM